jgi:hypothetical protein
MAYLSRSAPARGGDDLASHLPDDLFEEAPSMEEALRTAPGVPGITVADLEVVRECAGSPGLLRRFIPETSSPSDMMMRTPPHLRDGGVSSALKRTVDDSPSYTLSPQSALKPPSFGDGRHGGGGARDKSASTRSTPSPPVAVYSYASSAGSARGMNGSFAGRPPRGDRAAFKPGSLPHPKSGTSFGNRAGAPPPNARQAQPAVKFTGAAFRSARDEYLDKVFGFLFRELGDGEWMAIKSKTGVSGRCRKPVTMPETYLEFFDSHRDKFEINSECTKVRLRDKRTRSDSGDSDETNIESLSDSLKATL